MYTQGVIYDNGSNYAFSLPNYSMNLSKCFVPSTDSSVLFLLLVTVRATTLQFLYNVHFIPLGSEEEPA
jgi:hypothetical protein